MSNILIVDDDKALARSLQIQLTAVGHDVRVAHSLAEANTQLATGPADLMFLDLKLPDGDGRTLLASALEKDPKLPVIMISGQQDMKATIEAMRTGAFDYIRKPLDLDQILGALTKAENTVRSKPKRGVETSLEGVSARPREIVGRSPAIVDLLKQIAVLSQSLVTVLIEGETGTGKELVARALHQATRPTSPFVAVNCGGIVPTLLESELFGHEKGAFTGAVARKIGKLELAGDGTMFFDEIGDLPLELQAKLLRALQEAEFERVGGTQPIQLRARVMAATHRDLDARVREGTFREDLFYRLAVARLYVPPLRDRPEDIPLLAEFLLARITSQLDRDPVSLSDDAIRRLQSETWPGNVRQLENTLNRAAAYLRGDVVGPENIQIDRRHDRNAESEGESESILSLRDAERLHVAKALAHHGWNITHTAEALDISPTTLRKKITDYDLRDPRGTG